MTETGYHQQFENAITPAEAYDPVYWLARARHTRERARHAPAREAAALGREANGYERLSEHAAAVLSAH